jgi:hypothetical protein
VPCDLGGRAHSLQIGLTGKTVTLDLYLAGGISGAGHHLAGCGGAKTIVAIRRRRSSTGHVSARRRLADNSTGSGGRGEEIAGREGCSASQGLRRKKINYLFLLIFMVSER